MVKKILMFVSYSVVALTVFCVFGFLVNRATLDPHASVLLNGIHKFVSFPLTVYQVLSSDEIRGIPPTFCPDLHTDPINELDYDVFGLNAFFGQDHNHWEIRLFNFRDDAVIHRWRIDREKARQNERQFANTEPRNCLLLPDRSLIAALEESNNLYRIDKDSNIIWHNTSRRFHHSLNPGPDSGIWACTSRNAAVKIPSKNKKLFYRDEYITKIDPETGEVLYDKSVSDILLENGYANFVLGFANRLASHYDSDPLHLNDIEPVFSDGPYWNTGDVFISLRHRSLIIHYRPENNQVIRLVFGPFLNQHDVDIISDSEISIFNNNGSMVGSKVRFGEQSSRESLTQLLNSNLVIYNYKDASFRTELDHHFLSEGLYTRTQGFQQRLSNGDYYVESQNDGIMYFMNDKEIVYKQQFKSRIEDRAERPHWIRIYEDINF